MCGSLLVMFDRSRREHHARRLLVLFDRHVRGPNTLSPAEGRALNAYS